MKWSGEDTDYETLFMLAAVVVSCVTIVAGVKLLGVWFG